MGLFDFLKRLFTSEPEIDKSYLKTFNKKSSYAYKHIYKSIYNLLDEYDDLKIGKTGDAYIRKTYDDYNGNYDSMYLIAKSKNRHLISDFERDTIKKFYDYTDNISRASGGKMKSYNGYYYLYVVAD